MTEDEEALPELIATPENPEAEQDQPVEPQTTNDSGEEPVEWVVGENGQIQVLNY
jgi:hypothetical protein